MLLEYSDIFKFKIMENEFLFHKVTTTDKQPLLIFAEFYQHPLVEKQDFQFASLTIMLQNNLNESPIYQSKSPQSLQCLNHDIEWSKEYFQKIR